MGAPLFETYFYTLDNIVAPDILIRFLHVVNAGFDYD